MKMKLFFLYFCVLVFSAGHVSSAPNSDNVVDPNDAKKIMTLSVMDVDLNMTMGQIKTNLEEQGYIVRCTWASCNVKEGSIMFSFSYPQKRYDRTPLNENKNPTHIKHTRSSEAFGECNDMHKAFETFCTNGKDQFPCMKINNVIKMDVMPRGQADDGWIYSMKAAVDSRGQCSMSLRRKEVKTKVPH